MKTAKDLELSLLLKEKTIQDLKLKIKEFEAEIERLKESEEYHRKGYAELYKRIDDALYFLELDMYGVAIDILKGDDKDGKN